MEQGLGLAPVGSSQLGFLEQVPDELCSQTGHAVELGRDKLNATYRGEGRHNNDVGSVIANRPVPVRRLVYYYEVTVLSQVFCMITNGLLGWSRDLPRRTLVALGFCSWGPGPVRCAHRDIVNSTFNMLAAGRGISHRCGVR